MTGFRPDFGCSPRSGSTSIPPSDPRGVLADQIHPDHHTCRRGGAPTDRELAQPEPGLYLAGMKSYGRAPSFLAMTGFEQARSVVAAIDGDLEAADRGGARAARVECATAPARSTTRGRRGGAAAARRRRARQLFTLGRSAAVTARAGGPVAAPAALDARRCAGLSRSSPSTHIDLLRLPLLRVRRAAVLDQADTGWTSDEVTGAFSVAQLVRAAAGVWVGRHLDRGPRGVMTARIPGRRTGPAHRRPAPPWPLFYTGWALAGPAMAGVLTHPRSRP